jgi:opacity protein-like surface antigen
MRSRWNALLAVVALVGSASSAQAQDADPEVGDVGDEGEVSSGDVGDGEVGGDGPAKPISVGLLLGYGISLEEGDGNLWGLGFGLRGGYNIDEIFLGVRFVYYLGDSEEVPAAAGGGEVGANAWELGLEVGYDVDVGGAIIRPALGLGLENITVDAGPISASEMYLYLAPGVAALFDVSEDIFLGAEARFKLVFADETGKALILLATGGMRF